LTGLVWLALGAAMLVLGAELFADNVTAAARRAGRSALALGVLVAGAEPEEALTAGIASARGHPQLAVGDAVGANLVVLTLSLGLAAVLTALPVSRRVVQYAAAAALSGAAALAVLVDGHVGRVEGALLVAAYSAAVVWVWRRERRPPAVGEAAESIGEDGDVGIAVGGRDVEAPEREPAAPAWLLVAGGVLLMAGGGWLAVTGAQRLVATAGLDDTGVGLTLLALATSAEMLALVVAAARHRVAEVALAGLVGAVAYNALVSLGVGALVAPLAGVGGPRFLATATACALLPAVVLVLGRSRTLDRILGGLLVAAYLVAVPVLVA
jgi:cation:H+ antiporter